MIRGPAGDGRVAAILRDDVAAAAAAVLASRRHDGATYDLTGPESFSLAEAAALLGARFVDETDEEAYASRADYGAPDWEVAGWVTSYQAIRDGSFDVVSPAVRELTGREPIVARGVPRRRSGAPLGRVARAARAWALAASSSRSFGGALVVSVEQLAASPRRPPRPRARTRPGWPATAWSTR